MSQEQFDALTRRLATSTSRRQMLKALAGGALAAAAGLGAVLPFRSAEAASHVCCIYICRGVQRKTRCVVGTTGDACLPPPRNCTFDDFAGPLANCSTFCR
jgi:hypothetical protein